MSAHHITLLEATRKGDQDIIDNWLQLTENHSDLNAYDEEGFTALHHAVKIQHGSIFKRLLDSGADVDIKSKREKWTSMHFAAMHNNVEIIMHLMNKNADVNARDKTKNTPVMIAAKFGAMDAFRCLIELGAKLDACDIYGKNIAFVAAEQGHRHILQFLITETTSGVTLCNAVCKGHGTALHGAAKNGKTTVVDVLLNAQVSLGVKDSEERTPIHLAAQKGHLEVLCVIIRHQSGSNAVEDVDKSADTPLHHACFEGHYDIAEELIKHGANVDARNEKGATPVHYAAFSGSAKIVELLIERGATIDYLAKESEDDTRLRTPLFMACEAGHIDVVRVLIQKEALTSNREASQLFNSLDVAIETENSAIAMEIVQHPTDWKAALRHQSIGYREFENVVTTPFRMLIRKMPNVAEEVLNRCVTAANQQYLGHFRSTETDYVVTMNYEFFEDMQSVKKIQRRSGEQEVVFELNNQNADVSDPGMPAQATRKDKHPLAIMVENDGENLLKHPLVNSVLSYKWYKYARWVYFLNLGLYLLYLFFLTTFSLLVLFPSDDTCRAVANGTLDSIDIQINGPDVCKGLSTAAYYFIPLCAAILILLTVGRLVVELFQFLKQTYHYFLNWINWMEITLYISTFFFVWLFHAPCWCPQEWQWQSGAVAVFLAWIVLIVFFQKLHLTGVYVLMFTTILVTFLKLTLLALLLVLSFSLSFYMLFETRSVKFIIFIIDVMTSTAGAGGLTDDNIPQQEFGIVYILWILFLILMPILLINLLIGLAVDDISGIQKAASLQRRILKVKLILDLEDQVFSRVFLLFLRKCLKVFLIKRDKTVKINHKFTTTEKLRRYVWGDLQYENAEKLIGDHADQQKHAEVEQILELMNQQNTILMKRLNELSTECKEIKKELELTKAAR